MIIRVILFLLDAHVIIRVILLLLNPHVIISILFLLNPQVILPFLIEHYHVRLLLLDCGRAIGACIRIRRRRPLLWLL